MIEIKNVVYRYESADEDQLPAINDLSLNIEKGEFLAILGHNGSGKSTLAKCLNGLLIPSEGEILIDGMSTSSEEEIWSIREKAGMVFQNPDNQIVATVVEEDVAFGAENLGVPSKELRERVDWALDVVGMTEYVKHAPHQLSGGQKQRVAIAGILAMNPDYIILDEPTAMLDPNGRKEVMETIMKLNREQNKTIILITHYMDEAVKADRVVVMEKGHPILDGAPREVFPQVDSIKKIGLDVPQVTEMAYRLKEKGIPMDTKVLNREEFVEELCRVLAFEI
ncbi:energy-coupling factor transporter ATPase [Peptoniphilus sp. KCTC 25270]|uniref:energy-coupling factor transporter ATPase n=1 Tax=Peptoniphilus sp. KCTC 25270 TaxID=2897414 RepID=UPI001E582867|nr:energy-coupling factor transporter ATPase [Peptoniphilus sp. KCTC 25270]MCD1146738.1 energy-coupling factor transporter ATPase [Peptoniphilus sp. KCTC 25270]